MTSLRTYQPNGSDSSGYLSVEQAQAQIDASPYCSLRKIVCEGRGDQLVLRGHVESYHLKQLAQETVRRQSSAQTIINLLTVD